MVGHRGIRSGSFSTGLAGTNSRDVRYAAKAEANSAVFAMRPLWSPMILSRIARRSVRPLSVPTSSAPMRRLWPSTSAAKTATRRRLTSVGLDMCAPVAST